MRAIVRKELICVALLIAIVAGFLIALELAVPNYFLNGDNPTYFLPAYAYNWRAVVEEKTIPLINWHQYLGQTYLGQGQNSVLYPPVYLAVWLSKMLWGNVLATIDILAAAHLLAAAVGMFYLLRRLRVSADISCLASVVWITTPFVMGLSKEWVNVAYAAAYFPLNFLLLEKLITKPSLKYALGLAVLKMFMFWQGYVQWEFLMIQFEVLYVVLTTVFLLRRKRKKIIKKFFINYGLSLIFLFFLIAPLFFPMLYTQQQSQSRSAPLSYDVFSARSVAPMGFFDAQILNFASGIHPEPYTLYVGLFSLIIVLIFLYRKSRERKSDKLVIFCICALVALLFSSVLYGLLYYVPLFNLFRFPYKYYYFFPFFLVIGLAGAANDLARHKSNMGRHAVHAFLLLVIVLNVLVVWRNKVSAFDEWALDNPVKMEAWRSVTKEEGRVFTYGVGSSVPNLYKHLTFNYATLFGYHYFTGYDPLAAKLNTEFTLNMSTRGLYGGKFDQALLDYLSVWSVKYIVTTDTENYKKELEQFGQLQKSYSGNNVLLYENMKSRSFVYETEQVERAVPFKFGINHVDAYPINPKAHKMTFSVAPLPLFYYYFDEKKAGRVTVQDGPIELDVPANTQKVTVRYVDWPFRVGVILFAACWMVLGGWYLKKRG